MDPLTHTLVGAGLAHAFFRRRVGPEAVPILAAASNLPDVDVLVHLTLDPAAITLRRSFGHSVFVLPLWSLLLAWLFKKKYPRQKIPVLFGLCLLGAATHVFFDLINSFGVFLLWPFSSWRPELAMVFIVDLALTAILAAPYLSLLSARLRPRLERFCRLSAAGAAAYLVFCAANRTLAERRLSHEFNGVAPDFSYVFPEPPGPHRWRGVLRRGNTYQVYLIHSLGQTAELRETLATALGAQRVEAARLTPLGRRLETLFFKAPVWTLDENEVGVFDLRFRSLLIKRKLPFHFRFRAPPGTGSLDPPLPGPKDTF